MADPVATANKCLKLAAPSSGATAGERANAIATALDIIFAHGLIVSLPPPPPPKVRRVRPTQQRSPDPYVYAATTSSPFTDDDWHAARIGRGAEVRCGACGEMIRSGEEAWLSASRGYRHYDITCYER